MAQRQGLTAEAQSQFEAVIAATGGGGGSSLELLALAAQKSLGQMPVSGDLDAILLARALALPVR
ncbi:MAG: hypothetical protein IPL75_13785 [Acidobacteria bacterium]|nr:hypothetical protein [Acidobacteriota bacterium]